MPDGGIGRQPSAHRREPLLQAVSIVRGDTIFIDVSDTGKGIDLKLRNEVFRPGFSTKKRGWGLGLSLSKRIIESYHKGKLFVKESKPGFGTTFRIKLKK